MKRSRADVRGKAREALEVRFEAQKLDLVFGTAHLPALVRHARIESAPRGRCFRHLQGCSEIYGQHVIVLMLIVHLLLGFRELRDARYYHDDAMVKRLLGLKHLPEVSTVSRALASADERSVENLRAENRRLVLERLGELGLARVTADLRWLGAKHWTPCRGHGGGLQQEEEGRGAATIRCLPPSPRRARRSMCIIARAMCMTPTARRSFVLQCVGEIRARRCRRPESRPVSIARSSVKPLSMRSTTRRWSSPPRCPLSAFPCSRA